MQYAKNKDRGPEHMGRFFNAARDGSANRAAWLMVLFSTIGTMCCAISIVMINTGLFMRPLGTAFGWSRSDVALSLSIGALTMVVANPLMGELIDRLGTRIVLILSQAGYGIATACVPFLIDGFGLTGFYIGFALICTLGAGSTIVGYVRLLSGWFSGARLRSRGLAMGACSSGVVLGAALSGPFTILMIEQFGWRGGFWGLSLFPLLIGLPVSIFCIREAPVERKAGPDNATTAPLPGLSLQEAIHTRPFWLLIVMVLLISSCLQGMSIHIAPFLSDHGLSAGALAAITMFNALIGIPARLLAGHMFDRYFAPYIAVVVFALPATGALLMASYPVLAIGLAGSILLAVGQGAESDFIGYLVSRYFGLKQSGRIFGLIYGVFMIGVAVGPFLFGEAFDIWGNYTIPFTFATVGLTLLCLILLALPRFNDSAMEQPVSTAP